MDTIEPLYILLNFFDSEVLIRLKSGQTMIGKFIKFYRKSYKEVEWRFLEKQQVHMYKSENDLHYTKVVQNHEILEVIRVENT